MDEKVDNFDYLLIDNVTPAQIFMKYFTRGCTLCGIAQGVLIIIVLLFCNTF